MNTIKTTHDWWFQHILTDIFKWLYQYDDDLERRIKSYKSASWIKKNVLKDQILYRFIEHKKEYITESFDEMYNKFLEYIDQHAINNLEIEDSLWIKLFREKENKKKIQFICQNSNIPQSIIIKAHALSNKNWYHNFWHQLWVAESVIRIAQATWLSNTDINLLAFASLFHDSSHIWINRWNDEEIAYNDMINVVSWDELEALQISHDKLKELILYTDFKLRWTNGSIMIQIIQDADLWGIWYGPLYVILDNVIDGWITNSRVSIYTSTREIYISFRRNLAINLPIKLSKTDISITKMKSEYY